MSDAPDILALPRDACVNALADALARAGGDGGAVEIDAAVSARRVWLDTYDWRLLAAGERLEAVLLGRRVRLRLRRGHGGDAIEVEIDAGALPRFVADLPGTALARRVARALDCRALLVNASLSGAVHDGRVLDRRRKIVARFEVWRFARLATPFVVLRPVRGFDAAARRLRKTLRRAAGAAACDADPLVEAAGACAVPPGGYPSWNPGGLDPWMRTDDALKRRLGHYAAVMDLNVPGMRADLDSEFLHDFRVGLRRTRALLRRVKGVFPAGRIAGHREDLAWLGRETGALRDLDVHALVFPDYVASLGAADAAALEPLMALVEREREEGHAHLAGMLGSPRFRRRWAAWRRFLDAPNAVHSRQPRATAPVVEVAGRAIRKCVRQALREGAAIGPESPASAYHELRKTCKNVRYLVDAFGELYPEKPIVKATRRLKRLQDMLGLHQDLDVHRGALGVLRDRLSDRGELGADASAAFERLGRELAAREAETRQRFAHEFERFRDVRLARAVAAGKGA